MANATIKALQERQKVIDDAVDKATAPGKKAIPAPKNPYKPGSARAKYWKRRQADKTKMKKVGKKKKK